jgi:hypothetical protein
MSRLRTWLSRALDGIDLIFDLIASLFRVLVRGAFRPDAKSFRGDRFEVLASKDVLVQTLELNAEDEGQARRVVTLDPERYLPLDCEVAAFDVAGPIEQDDAAQDSVERTFLLGLARRETLDEIREASKRLLTVIEGFTFRPADFPDVILVFRDPAGDRQRRLRRALTAFAFIAFTWSAAEAFTAWRARLDRQVLAAESETLDVQRRTRLAEYRLTTARTAIASLDRIKAPSLGEVIEQIEVLARRQPQDAEVTALSWTVPAMALKGRAYSPVNAELELRRGYEAAVISFNIVQPGDPSVYQASVGWLSVPTPLAAKSK